MWCYIREIQEVYIMIGEIESMKKMVESALELIGNTPLLRATRYTKDIGGAETELLAKLEYLNPTGSAKDRPALAMIEDAEERGLLNLGATIIEPTSGNTGIGLASVAAIKGYKVILTLPETMSVERRNLLKGYGASLVLTDGKKGMKGAIEKAEELQKSIPGAVILGQFDNESNPRAHYNSTGPEILEQTEGNIDILIATVGTGGTISGTAKYLKEQKKNLKVFAVEPEKSPVLSGGQPGPHNIQGIGGGFVPNTLDTAIYDGVLTVTEEEAYEEARRFAKTEGILVGISSGAALAAARKVMENTLCKGKNIVVILPDSGDRYLSTPLFSGGN